MSRMSAPRICHVGRVGTVSRGWHVLERSRDLGFDTVLAVPENGTGGTGALAHACESRGLSLFFDLDISELDPDHPLVKLHPEAFAIRHGNGWAGPLDPRKDFPVRGRAHLLDHENTRPLVHWWSNTIG